MDSWDCALVHLSCAIKAWNAPDQAVNPMFTSASGTSSANSGSGNKNKRRMQPSLCLESSRQCQLHAKL